MFLRRDDNGLRGRKIGFADFHVDDVTPLLFELPGTCQQFHDVKGSDVGEPGSGIDRHDEGVARKGPSLPETAREAPSNDISGE